MFAELGIKDFDEKNLKGCCCFHQEDSPSLIYNHKNYTLHCFGCQKTVDIIDVFMLNGSTYIEAVQKLFDLVDMKYSFGEANVKTKHQYKYPKEVVCENKDTIYKYFENRKISQGTVDLLDVREDEKNNVVFNFYDTNDVLTMVKYKPSHKLSKGEPKCWCQQGADTTPLLFNMNRINTNNPLLICEGEPDCMAAVESGYLNSVSVPLGAGNYQWIEENWAWLEQFNNIIICSDNDEAGMKMQKEVIYRLGSWRTKVVEVPTFFEKEDGKKIAVKDLNEVLYWWGKEKVLDIILNAKDSPVDSVADFSDIKNIDLNEVDGITIGIKELDKALMKLFYGTFNIITGVNGSGKSSFLSQLICQCLDQEKNAFLYSGELPNFQSKNWINYILSGQRHLKQYQYNETVYWKVTQEAQKKIDTYYQGRLFIYKDGYDHKVSTLLQSMEDTVRKYGVKLLILDNMTSINLDCNDNNKYEKQAELVTALIEFAKRFNVAVILVVHPHKLDTMRRMTKMDVQGISAIIDLAHRIISLYRVTAADKKGKPKNNGKGWYQEPIKYDVLCDILKDRMMGFEGSGVGMYYDRPSRRFFTNIQDLDFQYQWDEEKYTDPLPFHPKQLDDTDNEIYGTIKGGDD